MSRSTAFICGLALLVAACQTGAPAGPGTSLRLASLAENRVQVEIFLELEAGGQAWLAARFTPEDGYHLYSKDIPSGGVDGVGRPTRLDLPPESLLIAAGELTESIPAQEVEDSPGLLIYPAGSVTLRLPVSLPGGPGWFEEQVSITFMACRLNTCLPPVVGKLVTVRVPGSEEPWQP